MREAVFRFHDELNDFVPTERRDTPSKVKRLVLTELGDELLSPTGGLLDSAFVVFGLFLLSRFAGVSQATILVRALRPLKIGERERVIWVVQSKL